MHDVKQTFRYDMKMSKYTITENIQETFWCYLTYLIRTSMKKDFIAAHYWPFNIIVNSVSHFLRSKVYTNIQKSSKAFSESVLFTFH